jgi:hypothetical protein
MPGRHSNLVAKIDSALRCSVRSQAAFHSCRVENFGLRGISGERRSVCLGCGQPGQPHPMGCVDSGFTPAFGGLGRLATSRLTRPGQSRSRTWASASVIAPPVAPIRSQPYPRPRREAALTSCVVTMLSQIRRPWSDSPFRLCRRTAQRVATLMPVTDWDTRWSSLLMLRSVKPPRSLGGFFASRRGADRAAEAPLSARSAPPGPASCAVTT